MSQVANTFCSFSGIVEVTEPPVTFGVWTNVQAILYGSDYTDVPILSKPDLFTVCLSFYNPLGIEFMVSSVLNCQGTFTVLESGSLPILSVRASSLTHIKWPFPGLDLQELRVQVTQMQLLLVEHGLLIRHCYGWWR
jgi:hypothetical protein